MWSQAAVSFVEVFACLFKCPLGFLHFFLAGANVPARCGFVDGPVVIGDCGVHDWAADVWSTDIKLNNAHADLS
jgi:hypothetical protein